MAHALVRAVSALCRHLAPAARDVPSAIVGARGNCEINPGGNDTRNEMSFRRLPHLYPEGRWLFVTWHLYGSLPRTKYPPPHKPSAGQAFVWIDRYLDRALAGPLFLQQQPIADLVVGSVFRGTELGHYQLGAFVLMANHVHVLLLSLVDPSHLLKSLKGYTAREANRLLGRTGEPFWQRESRAISKN